MTSTHHLEQRVERLESKTHTESKQPAELTKDEKEKLAERFDVEPMGAKPVNSQ